MRKTRSFFEVGAVVYLSRVGNVANELTLLRVSTSILV